MNIMLSLKYLTQRSTDGADGVRYFIMFVGKDMKVLMRSSAGSLLKKSLLTNSLLTFMQSIHISLDHWINFYKITLHRPARICHTNENFSLTSFHLFYFLFTHLTYILLKFKNRNFLYIQLPKKKKIQVCTDTTKNSYIQIDTKTSS